MEIAFSSSNIDEFKISGVRFLMWTVSHIPPAFSMAAIVSYSQFVPGKMGMMALGVGSWEWGVRSGELIVDS